MLSPDQLKLVREKGLSSLPPASIAAEIGMTPNTFKGHMQESGYRLRMAWILEPIPAVPIPDDPIDDDDDRCPDGGREKVAA